MAWRGATLISDDPGTWEDIAEESVPYDYTVAGATETGLILMSVGDGELVLVRERDGRLQKCKDPDPLVVFRATRNPASQKLSVEVIESFFSNLDNFLAEVTPANKLLKRTDEEHLARYCYVLALFEDVTRSGRADGSPLFWHGPKTSVPELLSTADVQWVDDICQMSWLFHEKHKELLPDTAILNPKFEGSRDIGGADADIILGSCLIDIKATVNPRITRDWLYQLLGYVLLDYSDQHRLDGVGVYLARQGVLLKWPLHWLMSHLVGRPSPPLEELRGSFKSVAQSLRRQARPAHMV